jgi:hypothetical protein
MLTPDTQPKAHTIGMGRFSLYYTEDDREIRFHLLDAEGFRAALVVVDPFPHWYSAADFSERGDVSSEQRPQIMEHIRIWLEKERFKCLFVDREGNRIHP